MADKVIKVWIVDGCIACNACVTECPQVFDVGDSVCVVKGEATNPEFVATYSDAVLAAAKACPTEVIKLEMGEAAAAAPSPTEVQKTEPAAEKPKAAEKPAPKLAPAAKPAVEKATAKPSKKIVVYKPKVTKKDPGILSNPMLQAVKEGEIAGQPGAKRALAAANAAGVSGSAPADQIGTILNVSRGYSQGIDLEKNIRSGVARNLFKAVFSRKHP